MLEVNIGGKAVDASDFDAVLDASAVAVSERTAQLLAERKDNPPTTDELIASLNYVMAATFAVYASLGSLLIVRETSGLYDESLSMLRDQLALVLGVAGSADDEEEPGIIVSER